MASKRIVWSQQACNALDEIFNYIARDSEYHAKRFISKIKQEVEKLTTFPYLGKLIEEDDLKIARMLIIKNYKVIYEPHENIIYIHTIIHGMRLIDFEDIFSK